MRQETSPKLAFITLGSNIEPEKNILRAIPRLAKLGRILRVSSVYQNPAIGSAPQPDYLNAAVLLETDLPASRLRTHLRSIESDLGRVRTEDKYAARTIDLDLCMLGQMVIESAGLTLPDPHLLTQAHLAVTIAELDPDYPHPTTGERMQAIADRLRPGSSLESRADVDALIDQL